MSSSSVTFSLLTCQLLVLLMLTMIAEVCGHGRLIEPPSRSSMWRLGYSTPHNYQDMELFCGGVGVQYGVNGGKCGVCGDPWNGERQNEAGGKYALGIIVRKYDVGQVVDVEVDLTANHKGYFLFQICPLDNPFEKATEECLASYPLAEESTGNVKIYVADYGSRKIKLKLRLPNNVKCRSCTFRWKYNAGNSWGASSDGQGCIGCGNQEQFYGCADVAVGYDDVEVNKPPVRHPWYTDTTTEWHYGIVSIFGNYTNSAVAQKLVYSTFSSIWFMAGLNLFIVVLVSLSAS